MNQKLKKNRDEILDYFLIFTRNNEIIRNIRNRRFSIFRLEKGISTVDNKGDYRGSGVELMLYGAIEYDIVVIKADSKRIINVLMNHSYKTHFYLSLTSMKQSKR